MNPKKYRFLGGDSVKKPKQVMHVPLGRGRVNDLFWRIKMISEVYLDDLFRDTQLDHIKCVKIQPNMLHCNALFD